MGNTYGKIFKITTFGESHGKAIGVVIDGCPAGLEISKEDIQKELDRRKPGQSKITTARKEDDKVEILSGIFEGKTLGTPIALLIWNKDQKSKDYSHIKDKFRPSHADFTYQEKYGIRDYRGGGRASARETACRVAAGAVAKKLLEYYGISINAYVSSVKNIVLDKNYLELDFSETEKNIVRCPDIEIANKMISLIEETKISSRHTGTAVGIISVIGFTPDIFFASIAGRILDASPGIEGHQQYFLMLSGFAMVGMLACILLTTYSLRIRENSKP